MELEPRGIFPDHEPPAASADPVVQRVEQALDEGRDDEALAAAEAALAAGEGNRLDLLFLAGDALLALGRAADAEKRFREVLAEDPTCPASRCWLAMALFRQCRFADAEAAVERALQVRDPVVDSHVVKALLLERRGDFATADALLAKAAAADPQKYPLPHRMPRAQFDREVRRAAKQLPRQFRKHLELVPVIVQDVPAEELLTRGPERFEPDILGLFDGVPLPDTAEFGADPSRPNSIFLFQRNLERFAKDHDDLVEQIRVTLYHELAHFLGFDEEDMDAMGLE